MDIFLLDMSESTERSYLNLTQGRFPLQAGFRGVTWSPDGDKLAFVTFVEDETRSSEIIVLDGVVE